MKEGIYIIMCGFTLLFFLTLCPPSNLILVFHCDKTKYWCPSLDWFCRCSHQYSVLSLHKWKNDYTKLQSFVRSWVDLCLICEYNTFTQGIIHLMKQYLENFHQLKNVVSDFCLRKRDKGNIARILVKNLCQLEIEVLDGQSRERWFW